MSPTALANNQSRFLNLPLELRREIYAAALPRTVTIALVPRDSSKPPDPRPDDWLSFVRQPPGAWRKWAMGVTPTKEEREIGHDIVWRRGCAALLAVSKQVHEEAAEIMYGENTFVVDITGGETAFRYKWLCENGEKGCKQISLLGNFSMRNLMRIRNFMVNVESVAADKRIADMEDADGDWTTEIKSPERDWICARVRELVDLLRSVQRLRRLKVHLVEGDRSWHGRIPTSGRVHVVQDANYLIRTQTVLSQFRGLHGVEQVQVTGVRKEYARELEASMAAPRETAHV
ncbi:hypothetical protein C7974DRAFT_217365 [Boeremia exigua]|uniref:uncharacterized protein n=1 Tax=Boeremia exigua TaxID=749465 RepID=UPI001E8DA0FE|nr:uncharacterized protein C7974DRAFT_217365 [Boeremia exigua]KAH6622169.1 hypothetical protein C7974DRAFT_217365 [Boeremia exigua]